LSIASFSGEELVACTVFVLALSLILTIHFVEFCFKSFLELTCKDATELKISVAGNIYTLKFEIISPQPRAVFPCFHLTISHRMDKSIKNNGVIDNVLNRLIIKLHEWIHKQTAKSFT
jgi:hypothetical protein